eukprot:14883562-Ditylum_brightwellii.AAC.1
MRYPFEAVGMLSGSCPSSSTLIINVWAKASPVACQTLLSQQHLVGDKWITGTSSNDAGKMQPVKVSATQIFHTFNKLACRYSNLPKSMKDKRSRKSPVQNLSCPCLEMT